jgi:hypothetical protein
MPFDAPSTASSFIFKCLTQKLVVPYGHAQCSGQIQVAEHKEAVKKLLESV